MSNSPENRHPVRAFLFSPFFAAAAIYLANWMATDQVILAGSSDSFVDIIPVVSMQLLAAVIVIWLVMVVFAVPIYFALRWLRLENAVVTILLAGVIATFFYTLPDLLWAGESPSFSYPVGDCQRFDQGVRTDCGWRSFWLGAVNFNLVGMIGGVAFWRIYAGAWVWRLPTSSRGCRPCA